MFVPVRQKKVESNTLSDSGIVRLKRRQDFTELSNLGRKWATPGLVLQVRPRFDSKIGLGFTVSRKVGKAVQRNRVRRRLKELARRILDHRTMGGHNLAVVGRKKACKRTFPLLCNDFHEALLKLKVAHKDCLTPLERSHLK